MLATLKVLLGLLWLWLFNSVLGNQLSCTTVKFCTKGFIYMCTKCKSFKIWSQVIISEVLLQLSKSTWQEIEHCLDIFWATNRAHVEVHKESKSFLSWGKVCKKKKKEACVCTCSFCTTYVQTQGLTEILPLHILRITLTNVYLVLSRMLVKFTNLRPLPKLCTCFCYCFFSFFFFF